MTQICNAFGVENSLTILLLIIKTIDNLWQTVESKQFYRIFRFTRNRFKVKRSPKMYERLEKKSIQTWAEPQLSLSFIHKNIF
jgi:hypothetical protein